MSPHFDNRPSTKNNTSPAQLNELCGSLPQTVSLRFVAASPQHHEDLKVIASLPNPSLQAAALDLVTGIGGPGCIPTIGEFGPSAKAIAPLLQKRLDDLANIPKDSEVRAREGMLNAALASVDPIAFAERLRNSPKEDVKAAVGAVVVYSLEGRAQTKTMERLAQSDVPEVKAAASTWLNWSQSSLLGDLSHISIGEGFANMKVAFESFLYKITSSPLSQKFVVAPLLRGSFAVAPIVLDEPQATEISEVGIDILSSKPGKSRTSRT